MLGLGPLRLDASSRLVSICPPGRDRPLLEARPSDRYPLVLAWLRGQQRAIGDWQARPASDDKSIVCTNTEHGLDLYIASRPASSGILLCAELVNRGALPVFSLRFQVGGALDIGPSPQITYPANSGWCIPLSSLGNDELLSLNYPVHAAMQWVDLYTTEEGLFLGVQDPLPYLKALLMGRQQGRPYLAWEYPHLQLEPGQTIRLPALHLAWHRGDWRAGADLYRSWIAPYIAKTDPPPWYRRKPAWNWVGLRGQHEPTPWHHADELPGLSERASALGIDLIQLTAYTEHGHDTGYPDYAVGASVGGPQSMQRAARAIHHAGRRISIYVNGRLVDPQSSISEREREEWAIRAESPEEIWRETYGLVTFDVMCPGAQAWNNLFIAKLAALVKRYGVDGVYVDQVCGYPGLPCYAAGHPHARPNEACAAFKPFIASLRLVTRGIKPDLFLATEGVNDLLGQYFDSMQSHEDWDRAMQGRGRLLPELYRYTFPDHLLNVGCIRANEDYYLHLAHTLGSGFDLGISDLDTLTPAFVRAVRWITAQRERNDALLHGARFCPLLDVDAEGYRANAFFKANQLLVAGAWLSSPERAPQAVQIGVPWPYDDDPVEAVADSPTGSVQVSAHRSGDRLHLALPRGTATTVTISTQGYSRENE